MGDRTMTSGQHEDAESHSEMHGSDDHGGMGERGVTRGMKHDGMSGEMSRDDRLEMLRMHHQKTLWVYWLIVLLGVWMVASPFALGYLNEDLWVRPSGGRGVWSGSGTHDALRAALMTWSDVLSGLLLIVFGWRSLRPNLPVSLWICCFVGIWLSAAPLVFWAPTTGAYLNNTIVGMLVIALSVLIPGMPNMIMYMKMGPPKPPGWSYNPSSWPQRAIMIALAFAGLLVSRYLAAFQLGYTDQVWEPFFDDGSRRVLNSEMSHMWPVSDAALGAFAYTFEFLMGWMGSPARWRTMPWMVTFFGILVIPLGLVHIFLVISQPVTVGAWCTLCLVAAAIMLPMIPLQVDEVIAMGQHLLQAHRRGESLWKVFWKGGAAEESETDDRTPEIMVLPERPVEVAAASLWGMSFPWTLSLSAALGTWVMFAPGVFGLEDTASNLAHLSGALIVVVSVVAMGEPLRAVRFLNGILALVVMISPWIASGGTTSGQVNALIVSLVLIALVFPRGPKTEEYGSWNRWVF